MRVTITNNDNADDEDDNDDHGFSVDEINYLCC